MSAAVATSTAQAPHQQMGSSKAVGIKSESQTLPDSKSQGSTSTGAGDSKAKGDESNVAKPLAPPPRPSQAQAGSDQADYFANGEPKDAHHSKEPNPFEKSFGQPETPESKSLLPGVAALTSPAPLAAEGASGGPGYSFTSSLRSGPLSPAMLGGPVGSGGDYFSTQPGATFPGVTPNESSLRTGLTPGGGGSMFPAPSPGSQAFMQNLANGGATPSTLDFHRTAINAAAASKTRQGAAAAAAAGAAAAAAGASNKKQADSKPIPASSMDPLLQQQSGTSSTFGQHDNDAASSLYLLAQSSNPQAAKSGAGAAKNTRSAVDTSPSSARNGNIGASHDGDDGSEESEPGRAAKGRGKKGAAGKGGGAAGGRRKADDGMPKPPSKKAKNAMPESEESEEEPYNGPEFHLPEYHANGKKMTDEEKRKNFLERNRVAALKCRQRKKQWLQNLQAKVEMFSTENDSLTAQVHGLREEIMHLKTLLLQHKDCPVSQSQGLGHYFQQQQDFNPHANPYGMGIANGHQAIPARR